MSLDQLVHIRRARGLTQAQLGQAAGLTQKEVSDLEHGRRPSEPAQVERIAAALEVEPAALTARRLTICTSPAGQVTVRCR